MSEKLNIDQVRQMTEHIESLLDQRRALNEQIKGALDQLVKLFRREVSRLARSYHGSSASRLAGKIEAVNRLAKNIGDVQRKLNEKQNTANPPSVPKYVNPDNPSQTWSGRGRPPKWFVDLRNRETANAGGESASSGTFAP